MSLLKSFTTSDDIIVTGGKKRNKELNRSMVDSETPTPNDLQEMDSTIAETTTNSPLTSQTTTQDLGCCEKEPSSPTICRSLNTKNFQRRVQERKEKANVSPSQQQYSPRQRQWTP